MPAPQQTKDGFSVQAVALASVGSVAAALVISRFGLAGTLIGAAVAPIVVTIAQELVRKPTARVVDLSRSATQKATVVYRDTVDGVPWVGARTGDEAPGEDEPTRVWRDDERVGDATAVTPAPRGRPPIRWTWVFGVSAIAFAVTVAVFTIPQLLLDRERTFLPDGPRPAVTQTVTTTPAETQATTVTTTAETTTEATTTEATTTEPETTPSTAPTETPPVSTEPTLPTTPTDPGVLTAVPTTTATVPAP